MGIARSTFCDKPAPQDDTAIVGVISGCEFRRNPAGDSDLIPATGPI
jgi:hypothetical protein